MNNLNFYKRVVPIGSQRAVVHRNGYRVKILQWQNILGINLDIFVVVIKSLEIVNTLRLWRVHAKLLKCQ